jgi:imidazolonepropionase
LADYDCNNLPWAEAGARAFIAAAHDLGIAVKVHAGRRTGAAAIAIAVESGAVSVDHVESAGPESLDLLAASGTMGVILPTTLDHMDRPFTTGRVLADAGAAIALGSDFNPGVPGTLSMQAVISLACSRLGLAPEEAISAATINAACALRRGDKVGSLDPGKAADLLILDTGDYRDLAYHFGQNLVAATIKRGKLVYEQATVSRGNAPRAPRPE